MLFLNSHLSHLCLGVITDYIEVAIATEERKTPEDDNREESIWDPVHFMHLEGRLLRFKFWCVIVNKGVNSLKQ